MGDHGPILVTGATGQQGGAVARALIAKGQKVRVMTRHPEKAAALAKAGADVVQGDLTNQAVLQLALRGVNGVFAMSTPFEAGMDAEVRQGMMMADAAKQAGITHYVYTSVGSADRHTRIPHFESKGKVEQHIQKIGLPATILRPVWFMDNFTTFAKPTVEGVITLPLRPARKLAMVALKDGHASDAFHHFKKGSFTIDLTQRLVRNPKPHRSLSGRMCWHSPRRQ